MGRSGMTRSRMAVPVMRARDGGMVRASTVWQVEHEMRAQAAAVQMLEHTFEPGGVIYTQLAGEEKGRVLVRVFGRPEGRGRLLHESTITATAAELAYDVRRKAIAVPVEIDDPEGYVAGKVAALCALELGWSVDHHVLPAEDTLTPRLPAEHRAG